MPRPTKTKTQTNAPQPADKAERVRAALTEIRDEVAARTDAKEDISIIRKAIERRQIVLHEFPEEYVREFVSIVWKRLERANKREDDEFVERFGKLLMVVQQENRKSVEAIDQGERLDSGKPTSIIANPTPELLAKIERIYAGQRKRVENTAARTAEENREADSPIGRLTGEIVAEQQAEPAEGGAQ